MWLSSKNVDVLSTVTNISQSFTCKMAAKINWHRYGTKLRHCHSLRIYRALAQRRTVKAKFHYTDPTGLCRRPARTNGVSRRSGSFGSARARVVESSYKAVEICDGGSTPALHQHASALISILRSVSRLSVCLSVCLRDGRDWTENGSGPGTTKEVIYSMLERA